jgi:hypothetical protein
LRLVIVKVYRHVTDAQALDVVLLAGVPPNHAEYELQARIAPHKLLLY